MNNRSKPLFSPAIAAALFLVCAQGLMDSSRAYSQPLNSHSTLSPRQIERMIEDRGYQLTGPVVRHGQVYLADVLGQEDNEERLIFDARDGRLLHRYPGVRRQADNPQDRSPLATLFDGLFGRQDDVAPLSPPPASDFLETPKPKPSKRPKSETKSVVQPTPTTDDNKATIAAPESTPTAPAPQATTQQATVGAKAAASPPPPETAVAAPSAPAQKSSSQKLNDVPVAPLE